MCYFLRHWWKPPLLLVETGAPRPVVCLETPVLRRELAPQSAKETPRSPSESRAAHRLLLAIPRGPRPTHWRRTPPSASKAMAPPAEGAHQHLWEAQVRGFAGAPGFFNFYFFLFQLTPWPIQGPEIHQGARPASCPSATLQRPHTRRHPPRAQDRVSATPTPASAMLSVCVWRGGGLGEVGGGTPGSSLGSASPL